MGCKGLQMHLLVRCEAAVACRLLRDLGIVDDSGSRPGNLPSQNSGKQYPLPKKEKHP